MKKFAAFLMILSVSVFTVGCGGKTEPKTPADKTPAAGDKTPADKTPADKTPAAADKTPADADMP